MFVDPIVEEVRAARDAYAKQFNYDFDAICDDLRRKLHLRGIVAVSPTKASQETEGKQSASGSDTEKE